MASFIEISVTSPILNGGASRVKDFGGAKRPDFTYNEVAEAASLPQRGDMTMAKRLYRSTSQKMLGGVCGGLAEYFDVDVSIFRLLFVATCLVTALFPMTFFYIIAWIVIPQQPKPQA